MFTGHVQVFDSVFSDVSDDAINQICCIVRSRRKNVKVDIVDVCKQKGRTDCGLFALANATTLCQRELPHTKQYIQGAMRQHLIQCFKDSCASGFPSTLRNVSGDHIKKTKTIAVHCTCRLPETQCRNMIQCTVCETWYHEECDVVEPKAWIDEDYPWVCAKYRH